MPPRKDAAADEDSAGHDPADPNPTGADAGNSPPPLTWVEAACIITISQLGVGVLGLPYAVARLGWLPGLMVVVVVAAGAAYSGVCLSRLDLATGAQVFAQIGQAAGGKRGYRAVQVVQYTEIAGFLIALLVTAGDALQQIVLYKGAAHSLCRVAALALVGVALLPLLQIQHLGHMTQLAVLGVVTIAAAVVLFVSQISSNPQASSHVVSPTADFDDFAFALSTIIFAFQGQSIFPELQARMYSPQQFPRAMLAALAVVLVVFLAIAVVTYNLLGSSTLYVPEYIADERSSTLRTLLGNICLLIYCIMVFVVNANVLLHLILDGIVRAAEKRRRGERGAWELEDGQSNEDQCIEAGGDAPAVPSARKELLNAVHISTDFSIVPSVPPRTRRRWSWSKSKAAARMERMRASHHRKARLAWLATTSTALAAAFVSANLLPTPRHIIALVGALCGFSLTFVIPAASALRVFAKSLTRPQCILHWTVATFGALATFIGAYATAKELIHAWKDSDNKPFHC